MTYRYSTGRYATTVAVGMALGACSTQAPPPEQEKVATAPSSSAPAATIPALTLEGYKKVFARKVAASSGETFSEPLPEMFRSIVVVDVTIAWLDPRIRYQ